MKCQSCGVNEASVRVIERAAGATVERHYCPACAASQAMPSAEHVQAPSDDPLYNRPIGRVLSKTGKITREQVVEGLNMQRRQRRPLGEILVDLGHISRQDVDAALAAQSGRGGTGSA